MTGRDFKACGALPGAGRGCAEPLSKRQAGPFAAWLCASLPGQVCPCPGGGGAVLPPRDHVSARDQRAGAVAPALGLQEVDAAHGGRELARDPSNTPSAARSGLKLLPAALSTFQGRCQVLAPCSWSAMIVVVTRLQTSLRGWVVVVMVFAPPRLGLQMQPLPLGDSAARVKVVAA